jgi:hypothetical protein
MAVASVNWTANTLRLSLRVFEDRVVDLYAKGHSEDSGLLGLPTILK